MYLLDTDVLIDIQREYAPALMWFATLTELPSVPGFVVMEFPGCPECSPGAAGAEIGRPVTGCLADRGQLPACVDPDFVAYHLSHNLGLLDALIAACATGLSATLCTFNVKHYRMVPGLVTVQPYAR